VARASAFLALACAACGTHFVEPNPPQLERAAATYTTSSAGEPTAYVVVLDLYLERRAGCADAHAFALQSIRSAMGSSAIELAVQDASPDCAQLSSRRIDVRAIDAALLSGQAAHPDAHLRAIVVYANNVDLPLPGAFLTQLLSVRGHAAANMLLVPIYWAFSAARPAADLSSDRHVSWTFAGDTKAASSFAALAAADLPLQSETGLVAGPLALLADAALHRAFQFKLCAEQPYVTPVGFAGDGSAQRLDPQRPPAWSVSLPPRYSIARTEFRPRTVTMPVELCVAHCERYYDYKPGDDPVVWNQVSGCLLPERHP
jgi:hypothetical protein